MTDNIVEIEEKYEESNTMKAVWFFIKIITIDTVIIFLLSKILGIIGWLTILSSIFLIIFWIILFIVLLLLSFVWEQVKAIEKDDENFLLNI